MIKNDDLRSCLTALIEARVIFAADQPDMYLMIRRHFVEVRRICLDNFGQQVTLKPDFVRLAKMPFVPLPGTNIVELQGPQDYVMFASVLAYTDDLGPGTPFLLQGLTEALAQTMPVAPDWTLIQERRRLVRVLKAMVRLGLLDRLDGEFEGYDSAIEQEALLSVTQYARYFLRSFPENLTLVDDWRHLAQPADDTPMRVRVLQQLAFTPGICRTADNEDMFRYMRNQSRFITEFFESNSEFEFELTRNVALLNLPERRSGYQLMPNNSSVDGLLLALGDQLRGGNLPEDEFGQRSLTSSQWVAMTTALKNNYNDQLASSYRTMGASELSRELLSRAGDLGMAAQHEDAITITPLFGRLSGRFARKNQKAKG